MNRTITWLVGGSLLALALLVSIVIILMQTMGKPVRILVAASLRVPMERLARDYQERTGQRIELQFGGSQDLLARLERDPVDLFLPADNDYIADARSKQLVVDVFPIGQMRAAVLLAPMRKIDDWAGLVFPGRRVAIANPQSAAIGRKVREGLSASGRWQQLESVLSVQTGTVTEAANAAKVVSVDAAIIWDSMAGQYHDLTLVRLPELQNIIGRVELATITTSPQPQAARAFVDYVLDPEHGRRVFAKWGLQPPEPAP